MYELTTPFMIFTGILTGLVFGFLLQRAGVTRYNTIVGQFLLKDFTILKTMLTAIIVGAIGIWGMKSAGIDIHMHVKSAELAANILGGALFGIGMVVLGFCPGTGLAAIGDGARHVWPGVIGMIVGGGLYAETYPYFKDTLLKAANVTAEVNGKVTNKVTFPDVTGLSPWVFIVALAVVAIIVFVVLEKKIDSTRIRLEKYKAE
ncbi:MAG TPA: YeeE/YedE family protein [Gammaproteobacteria bacterium]|nr:YeeE/YedE family protein [Gammaproteobacteria bacterium]